MGSGLDSYARLSRNPSGRLVETQHGDNGEVITRLGGVLGEQISDNSLSAWSPKVRRPGWERLLERVWPAQTPLASSWGTTRSVITPVTHLPFLPLRVTWPGRR